MPDTPHPRSVPESTPRWWSQPLVSMLVRSRALCGVLLAVAIGQAALVAAGFPGWTCLFHEFTGIPCPGCGLSRSAAALARLDPESALHLHAFGLLLPAALLLLFAGVALPACHRDRLAAGIARVERHIPLALLLTAGLFAYWIMRLAWGRGAFLMLLSG
jgi:hypothetical protein